MATKRRHWKEKDGRFWARVAIPAALRPQFGGRTQLTEALGGNLRAADRAHAAAVARLQAQIEAARCPSKPREPEPTHPKTLRQVAPRDREEAVWAHYTSVMAAAELKRASMPTPDEIEAEKDLLFRRLEAGEADPDRNPMGMFNVYADYEMKANARKFDSNYRTRRLMALRASLAQGDTRLVEDALASYVNTHGLEVPRTSAAWRDLAEIFARAEIEALQRTVEQDEGHFGGQPSDPLVRPPTVTKGKGAPVSLTKLFADYVASRQAVGSHRDGGDSWKVPVQSLRTFVGHDDAQRITKRNLLDWRDSLLSSGMAPKTIADKYLAAIRAILRWGWENDQLTTNEAESVHQKVARKVRTRERGYTDTEAVQILQASISYKPASASNPANRESAHMTAAKTWVPMLCAFSGARITEITQLRKEDIRCEGDRWVVRISPDAGSVKTGHYRDVPLHHQVVQLGFIDFVQAAHDGPLFHGATQPERYLSHVRVTSGRLGQWLHSLGLVPDGIQPNYGWRHRFKTQGRELGMSDRVLDAIQGHAAKTAGDDYGDVSIAAKQKIIDALPPYPLLDRHSKKVPRRLGEDEPRAICRG